MGMGFESFKIGMGASSGATLGSMATAAGIECIGNTIGAISAKSDREYKAANFDKFVRDDLVHLMAEGRLTTMANPFPPATVEDPKAGQPFYKRHPFWTVIFAAALVSVVQDPLHSGIVVLAFVLIVFGISQLITKVAKTGSAAISSVSVKTRLAESAESYWLVREHMRQELEGKTITAQGAYKRLLTCPLVRSLPDSVETLDAHVYNYKKTMGLL